MNPEKLQKPGFAPCQKGDNKIYCFWMETLDTLWLIVPSLPGILQKRNANCTEAGRALSFSFYCQWRNPMKEDLPISLLIDGKEAFSELLLQIGLAKKSILINMFIWREDRIGLTMAKAILAAAERGVQIEISVDRYALVLELAEESRRSFFHENPSLRERLKAKILYSVYMRTPKLPPLKEAEALRREILSHPNIRVSRHIKKYDHSKYYIFDGETLILGGINIEDKENGADLQGRVYQDYMVKLKGKAYVEAFLKKLTGKEDLLSDCSFAINLNSHNPPIFEIESHYLSMIREAEERLMIVMAYFSAPDSIFEAILAAVERGVSVSLLIPEKANFQNDSNRMAVKRLMKASGDRIKVYLCPKMVHTKLVANEKRISFGSANINKNAFHQLSEVNLVLSNTDAPLQQRLNASAAHTHSISREISHWEEISYRPLIARIEQILI